MSVNQLFRSALASAILFLAMACVPALAQDKQWDDKDIKKISEKIACGHLRSGENDLRSLCDGKKDVPVAEINKLLRQMGSKYFIEMYNCEEHPVLFSNNMYGYISGQRNWSESWTFYLKIDNPDLSPLYGSMLPDYFDINTVYTPPDQEIGKNIAEKIARGDYGGAIDYLESWAREDNGVPINEINDALTRFGSACRLNKLGFAPDAEHRRRFSTVIRGIYFELSGPGVEEARKQIDINE